eukprot:6470041-Amphidinium_carterae.2
MKSTRYPGQPGVGHSCACMLSPPQESMPMKRSEDCCGNQKWSLLLVLRSCNKCRNATEVCNTVGTRALANAMAFAILEGHAEAVRTLLEAVGASSHQTKQDSNILQMEFNH